MLCVKFIYNNLNKIQLAIRKATGNVINMRAYWSSDESSAFGAWNYNFLTGYSGYHNKNNIDLVRPVLAF